MASTRICQHHVGGAANISSATPGMSTAETLSKHRTNIVSSVLLFVLNHLSVPRWGLVCRPRIHHLYLSAYTCTGGASPLGRSKSPTRAMQSFPPVIAAMDQPDNRVLLDLEPRRRGIIVILYYATRALYYILRERESERARERERR